MKSALIRTFITSIIAFFLLAACVKQRDHRSNLDYVDPHIGGMGHLLHPTRPNVQLPNQMIRMHPVRNDYLDDQISFFPLTMISHRKGELFGIMPYTGSMSEGQWGIRQTYDHDLEIVKPYYYSTYFIDSDIRTEFTPGNKTGYFRFIFPDQNTKILQLQVNHSGGWRVISDSSASGEEVFSGMKAYIYCEFNQTGKASLDRQESYALYEFPVEESTIDFKYGISFISAEQAKINLENEIPSWDFEALKKKGKEVWSDKLDQIQLKGGTEAQRRTFYTSLYRCYERMVNINEDGKYYSAYDHAVHEDDRDFYVDDWVWDT
ncbi:MAG: glycoside hydrolase family 92 protein, partial [Bacteroidota bacterium]|nr:glycoside hydrolase family 92 protein [Bacteroidota bacterium]